MDRLFQKFKLAGSSETWGSLLKIIDVLNPWQLLLIFIVASIVLVWRLSIMEKRGVEGTILGTLIMPYCSGLSNLIFAYVLARSGGSSSLVLENCLVNNVTNLTLILALPTLIWGMNIFPGNGGKKIARGQDKVNRLNHLSLLLTLIAMAFFTGITWVLAADGTLTLTDGLVLVGLFLFWQIFHLFDVLKNNVRHGKFFSRLILVDLILIAVSACGIYFSIDRLVEWISSNESGFFIFERLGWLSGWLMVLPNALLAIYYARINRPDIVYSSQIGDGHICIPMCIGLFALFRNIEVPSFFDLGIIIVLGATLIHFLLLATLGRIPKFIGFAFIGAYGFFLYKGL